MQLYRRKPEYALAIPTHREGEGFNGAEIEYAVQPCDEHGTPLSTHLSFVPEEIFVQTYTVARGRPKAKVPGKPAKPRNGPARPRKKIESVSLNEVIEEETAHG